MIGIVGGMRCCKKVKRNNENLEERVSNKMKFVDFFSGVGGVHARDGTCRAQVHWTLRA